MTTPVADPSLANVLKDARERIELTQEELAGMAGLTASALSRIERGLNSPNWHTVRAIAEALEVSMRDIVGWVEEEDAAE